jgi:hypothetical protein
MHEINIRVSAQSPDDVFGHRHYQSDPRGLTQR